MPTEEDIKAALRNVKYPGYSRDVVSFGLVREVSLQNDAVSVVMQLTTSQPEIAQHIKSESERVLKELPGVRSVFVDVRVQAGAPVAGAQNPWAQQNKVPGIQHVVAVASGKGGVGKSTVAANLACALRHLGARVGLLDCDIYGPSIPLMMGVESGRPSSPQEKMVPPVATASS